MLRLRFQAFCLVVVLAHYCVANKSNVLFIVVDNMRPPVAALTPHMNDLSARGTLFSRAFCQISWCAPSRNSFLSGRRPVTTEAYNFVNHFREAPGAAAWTTLPGHFKANSYWTTSVGKVFHPNLPPQFDFPQSWSELPVLPEKPPCPNNTMTCQFEAPFFDADADTTNIAIERLQEWANGSLASYDNFFLAVGFQSPRLPWSAPREAFERYPAASEIPVATHTMSPTGEGAGDKFEWFRPSEINLYSDIRNVTHSDPLTIPLQHEARRAYYSAITHVDDQVGRLLDTLKQLKLDSSTVIALVADHGQNLGEHNTWSMMNVLDSSLRVPMSIVPASNAAVNRTVQVYPHPVELIDLYPTLASLAGLPQASDLPGTDLSPGMVSGAVVKPVSAAFSQITRCRNCTESYLHEWSECVWDEAADSGYFVPCCFTPRDAFDLVGLSVRTASWRYTAWCGWDGERLEPAWDDCPGAELYDHRGDTAEFDVDAFENVNLAGDPVYRDVQEELGVLLRSGF